MAIAYGYVFNRGTQEVLPGESINFSHTGPKGGGIIHFAGDDNIFFTQSGFYLIQYTVLLPAGTRGAYALFLNGQPLGLTTSYAAAAAPSSGNIITGFFPSTPINGQAILFVPSNSEIDLRNIGATTDRLPASVDGAPVINASITIVKLDTAGPPPPPVP